MGLRRPYLEFIEEGVASTLGGFGGLRMLELGNQRISRRQGIPERTGKEWYTRLGADHTSVDFNGRDGAVKLDLSQPILRPDWDGAFDLITNPGTSEHVEPKAGQYECFANLHRWLRPGGIVIHLVPVIEPGLEDGGRWRGHCNQYYSLAFFERLAALNGYDLAATRLIRDLRGACLRKREDRPFEADREAFLASIEERSGGIEYYAEDDPRRRQLGVLWRRWRRKLGI